MEDQPNGKRSTGRKSGEGQHLDEVLALYRAGRSMGEIGREVGISTQTISRWLKKAGVEVDYSRGGRLRSSMSDEHKAAISAARRGKPGRPLASWRSEARVCRCGEIFTPKSKTQSMCSVACRNQAGAEAVRLDRRCPCGIPLPALSESHASYCSPECRATYGKKRQRDEANYVTFDCRGCGKSVERYRKYGNGALLFCSNECAVKHTKTKHHIVLRDHDVLLDSSYEAFVWGALRIMKVPVERFDRQYGIEWAPGHWYAPDFWLPQHDLAIEVKGLEDDRDADRWIAYQTITGKRLLCLTTKVLESMTPRKMARFLDETVKS